MGKDQLDDLELYGTNYIEDLGWDRLELYPSKMMEMMEDHEVWRLNLQFLPRKPHGKSGQ